MLSKEAFAKVISEFPWLWAVWSMIGYYGTSSVTACNNIKICRMDAMKKIFLGGRDSKPWRVYTYYSETEEEFASVAVVQTGILSDDPRKEWSLSQWLLQPEYANVTAFAFKRFIEGRGCVQETIIVKPLKNRTIKETLEEWVNQTK